MNWSSTLGKLARYVIFSNVQRYFRIEYRMYTTHRNCFRKSHLCKIINYITVS